MLKRLFFFIHSPWWAFRFGTCHAASFFFLNSRSKFTGMGRILAVDYGRKRCGIAVTDALQLIATPLATVETHGLWDFLEGYMAKEEVECVVVGEPRQMDYTPSESERYIRPFLSRFKKVHPRIRLEREDERFTSRMAMQAMISGGLKKKKRQDKALVDATSAVLILQSYMQRMEFRKNVSDEGSSNRA